MAQGRIPRVEGEQALLIRIPDPALVLLIGPTGSGKSTFAAANFKPLEIVSTDHLRGLLSNDPADQAATADAFRILNLIVTGRVARRLTTVIDATSLLAPNRTRYRRIAAAHGVPVVVVAFDLAAHTYHARNRGRYGRVVDDDVVERQIEQMTKAMAALRSEGYAALHVVRDGDQIAVDRS
ncbi:MAG: AAA family ATPase [Chloroflexota bacterium]